MTADREEGPTVLWRVDDPALLRQVADDTTATLSTISPLIGALTAMFGGTPLNEAVKLLLEVEDRETLLKDMLGYLQATIGNNVADPIHFLQESALRLNERGNWTAIAYKAAAALEAGEFDVVILPAMPWTALEDYANGAEAEIIYIDPDHPSVQ